MITSVWQALCITIAAFIVSNCPILGGWFQTWINSDGMPVLMDALYNTPFGSEGVCKTYAGRLEMQGIPVVLTRNYTELSAVMGNLDTQFIVIGIHQRTTLCDTAQLQQYLTYLKSCDRAVGTGKLLTASYTNFMFCGTLGLQLVVDKYNEQFSRLDANNDPKYVKAMPWSRWHAWCLNEYSSRYVPQPQEHHVVRVPDDPVS